MKDFLSVICSSQLFSGVTETELTAVLACLDAKKTSFPKEAYLMHTGDTAEAIGFVLSGNVLTVQEDIWGNRHILSNAGPGQTFAAAFACAPGAVLNVSVVAQTPVTVMFLNVRRILSVCTSACSHHSRIIRNLLGELADKNLMLSEKVSHMRQRHFTEGIQHLFPDPIIKKLHQAISIFLHIQNFCTQTSVAKDDLCTGAQLFAGLYEGFPDIVFHPL